jgi:hypothetical protein
MLVWTYSDIFYTHSEMEKKKTIYSSEKLSVQRPIFLKCLFNCRKVASWPPKNSGILLNARLLDEQFMHSDVIVIKIALQ